MGILSSILQKILRWLAGGSSSRKPRPDPDAPLTEGDLEMVRMTLREQLATGFATPVQALEATADLLEDEFPRESVLREAEQILPSLLVEMEAEQAAWPEVTDCDRLDRAFADLESRDIIARQNFSCCMTCGSGEIWEEMKQESQTGRVVRGYAFYHEQDTEAAANRDGLYLAYGSMANGKQPSLDIGHEIVETLTQHGFQPDWDGKLSSRIHLPLDWKRRIPPTK
jgi:hypothetical protein